MKDSNPSGKCGKLEPPSEMFWRLLVSSAALLCGIIDYAGLFPPAALPSDQALENYARYLGEKEAWLLGRFVCPAARLQEIVPLASKLPRGMKPLVIAVVGRGGKDAQDYFANVKADLGDMARLRETLGDAVSVTAYEVRLPASAFSPLKTNQLSSLIATTAYLCETAGPSSLTPFFESPLTDRAALLAVIQALHDDHHSSEARARRRCLPAGFKLRAGGLEPAAIPTSAQVALVLGACAAARVPFKATAGLHHPLRHYNKEMNAVMHGFVNVFAAGCLAMVHHLNEETVLAIVDEQDGAKFLLAPDGLRWRGLEANAAAIAEARMVFTSFGSCSFDEPRDDLRRLGWLKEGS